jgi:ribosomal protein S18 acetylase RimI-like enzyme
MATVEVRSVSPGDIRRALRVTLAMVGQSPSQRESQVRYFLQHARALRLDAGRSWWCLIDGREVCACTCLESPGRTAMLLLPDGALTWADDQSICEMIDFIVAEEARRDIRLVQCLPVIHDQKNASALARAGFSELAELLYMEWTDDGGGTVFDNFSRNKELAWLSYNDRTQAAFHQLIEQTYTGSLDCPGLTGLRHIDDIIAGHRAAGRFSPDRWLAIVYDGRPAGCILLLENPLRPVLEVAYMGVHPSFRGRHLGHVLISRGLTMAHRDGFTKVALAVDSRNQPALRLYTSAGFHVTTRRRAMIRPLTTSVAAK